MENPEQLGRDDVSERDLLLLHVGSSQAISTSLKVSAQHFVCLLAWDCEQETVDEISRVAEVLLGSGCVYFCTWGGGCERVHDIIDEIISADPDPASDSNVMTTWHDNETLDDALWFFLRCTNPDQPYEDSCRAALTVLIGNDADRSSRIRYALTDPQRFSKEVLDNEK